MDEHLSSHADPRSGQPAGEAVCQPARPAFDLEAYRNALRQWMEVCLPGVNGIIRQEPDLPPDGEAIAENLESVTQKELDRVRRLAVEMGTRGKLLARQGAVVATWRQYKGEQLGPYYCLVYREDGQQKSIYLGASAWVAEQARWLLTKLQTPLRTHRDLQRAKAMARTAFRAHQAQAKALFSSLGIRVKGLEYRGFVRHLRGLNRQRDEEARQRRKAAAWRVITGADQGGGQKAEVGSGKAEVGSGKAEVGSGAVSRNSLGEAPLATTTTARVRGRSERWSWSRLAQGSVRNRRGKGDAVPRQPGPHPLSPVVSYQARAP